MKVKPDALAWFATRGISQATLEQAAVGSGTLRGRSYIFYDYGNNGWKARTFPEKEFTAKPGFKPDFWGLPEVLEANPDLVFIVEGENDRLALIEAGIPPYQTLAAPNASTGLEYAQKACQEGLGRAKRFVWCGDADEAGYRLRDHLIKIVGVARFWHVTWPDGIKDANEMLVKEGSEALLDLVMNGALPWPHEGLFRLSELPTPPPLTIWTPDIPGFEDRIRLAPGTLSVVTGQPGHGKALALDTPIPTPFGWSTMGDLQVGDEVFDETGAVCEVTFATEVMHNRACYRVIFDDGSEIVADAEHLWETTLAQNRANRAPQVVTTAQIANSIVSNGKRNHAIVVAGPIDLPEADLLIDPYTLGAWLGDGSTMGAIIHSVDPEIAEEIRRAGFPVEYNAAAKEYRVRELQRLLRFEGVLGNKHVPPQYLRGSLSQRLSLLQGLMDTDGYINQHTGYQCEFVSTNKRIAEAVLELANSLGHRAKLIEGRATLYGKDCGPKYRVFFRHKMQVFRLPRKVARLNAAPPHRIKHRYITQCISVKSVPVKCIQVSSPSHLYLAGKNFIPTHNTMCFSQLWFEIARKYDLTCCIASFETGPKPHLRRQIRTLMSGKLEIEMSEHEQAQVDAWIDAHYLFIVHQEQRPTLEWFLDLAETAVIRHGARVVQLDPWNRLEAMRLPRESETEYVLRCLRALYVFAKDMSCHVQIVAHPAKMDGGRRNLAPTLEDISGSKHWENVVDQGFVIHRPHMFEGTIQKTETAFRHLKARYEELGYPCQIMLNYDLARRKYVPLSDGLTAEDF